MIRGPVVTVADRVDDAGPGPQLKGLVIGTGGSTHFSYGDGPKSFVTGSLELDSPQITEELSRADGAAYAAIGVMVCGAP